MDILYISEMNYKMLKIRYDMLSINRAFTGTLKEFYYITIYSKKSFAVYLIRDSIFQNILEYT